MRAVRTAGLYCFGLDAGLLLYSEVLIFHRGRLYLGHQTPDAPDLAGLCVPLLLENNSVLCARTWVGGNVNCPPVFNFIMHFHCR